MGKKIPIFVIRTKKTTEFIQIVQLSDIHYGHEDCDEKRFQMTLNYILNTPDTYVDLNGDLIEFSTRSQKGNMIMSQKIQNTPQFLDMTERLRPLAKEGKILGLRRDNHLQRAERDAMIDLNAIMADALGVEYLGVGGFIIVKAFGHKWRGACHHGKDAAKNPFLCLERMKNIYKGCDWYALGHNHQLAARKVVELDVDKNNEECGLVHWEVRTGSYLKYAEYAREGLYSPGVIGSPIIRLHKDGRCAIDIDTLSWVEVI